MELYPERNGGLQCNCVHGLVGKEAPVAEGSGALPALQQGPVGLPGRREHAGDLPGVRVWKDQGEPTYGRSAGHSSFQGSIALVPWVALLPVARKR